MARIQEDADPVVVDIAMGDDRNDASYFVRRSRGSGSWLVILTLEGSGKLVAPGAEVETQVGDVALFAPRIRQEYGTAKGSNHWRLLWAHFHTRPHWQQILDWPPVGSGLSMVNLRDPARLAAVEADMQAANRVTRGHDRFSRSLAMAHLEAALIRCRQSVERTHSVDARIQAAMDAASNLSAAWDVPAMARRAGLSPSQFTRLFRSEMGKTPRDWLESCRIDQARQLLAMSDLTLRTVAQRIGFESEFYFSRRFRLATGMAPSEYRAVHRNSARNRG